MKQETPAVRLTGKVKPHPTRGYRDWEGALEAAEPFVAISIIKCENTFYWAKSSHRGSTSLPVRILLAPMDAESQEVQVNLSIGDDGHVRCITSAPSKDYRPDILLDEFGLETLRPLGIVAGEPLLELAAVAIPMSRIESRRNGLWVTNEAWIAGLDVPLQYMLTHGRSGTFTGA